MYHDKVYINKRIFFDVCKPLIALNGNYSGTEDAFLNTLVHIFCLVETPYFRVERKQDLFLFLLNVIIFIKNS